MSLEDQNFESTVLKCINEITKKQFSDLVELCNKYNIKYLMILNLNLKVKNSKKKD